jgi:hypothetical protein
MITILSNAAVVQYATSFPFTGYFFHISSLLIKNFYQYDICATKSFNCTIMDQLNFRIRIQMSW